jgi:hypothetical protein
MTQLLAWLQANSASLWFGLSVAIVVVVWLFKRYQDYGGNAHALVAGLASEAIAAALVFVRGAADQITRQDLDTIVAFLYPQLPAWMKLLNPLDKVQETVWGVFQIVHNNLDTERKAQIIGLVRKSRAIRGVA